MIQVARPSCGPMNALPLALVLLLAPLVPECA
jgi:hypothetical protein